MNFFNFILTNGWSSGLEEDNKRLRTSLFKEKDEKIQLIKLFFKDDDQLNGMVLYDAAGEELNAFGILEDSNKEIAFADNEKIIGIKYRFHPDFANKAVYKNLQFIVSRPK